MHQIKQMIKTLKKENYIELDPVEDLVNIHDAFLYDYGWMSIEEFINIPIPTALNLAAKIKERYKEMNSSNGPKRNRPNKS